MEPVDYKVFNENLLLTQAYCELQLKSDSKNPATIFRSINPEYNCQPIFSFKLGEFNFEPYRCFLTQWSLDPLRSNDFLFNDLYKRQLTEKRETIKTFDERVEYKGKIFVAEIDMTVIDGASEVASEGLIDINDWPPIDTWFYTGTKDKNRILFAWIPESYVELANDAIEVNCVDCIYWYNEKGTVENHWYYNPIEIAKTPPEPSAIMNTSFWTKVKNLFTGK